MHVERGTLNKAKITLSNYCAAAGAHTNSIDILVDLKQGFDETTIFVWVVDGIY